VPISTQLVPPALPFVPAAPRLVPPPLRECAPARSMGGMPKSHRAFAWLLLLRRPLASEREDIAAALAWLTRHWVWLALGYLVLLSIAVWPAFADGRPLAERVVAVVGTHFLLWALASTIANCWVGFRVLDSLSFTGALQAIVGTTVAFALFFAVHTDPVWRQAFKSWWAGTFGSIWWFFGALMLVVYGVPDLVARLRRRERAAVTRALKAETASERLARQSAESELRLLQAQIEPHFLYNTLANLRFLIQKNAPDALAMTDSLIEYLRTSVPDMRAKRVALGREADHVRHYLQIMRLRLGGRLDFAVDVPETLRAVELPPLVLLTLVENAIKHGIAPLVEGGRVEVRAREEGAAVVIEVADTGVGLASAREAAVTEASTGAGLANARGRLWLTYGEAAELTLAANEPRGTIATVRIPRVLEAEADARRPRVLVMSSEEWSRVKKQLPETPPP
jgi:signal transduction histidine kinase